MGNRDVPEIAGQRFYAHTVILYRFTVEASMKADPPLLARFVAPHEAKDIAEEMWRTDCYSEVGVFHANKEAGYGPLDDFVRPVIAHNQPYQDQDLSDEENEPEGTSKKDQVLESRNYERHSF